MSRARTEGTAMQTIVTILGTRPEAIKMAPVIKEIQSRRDRLRCCVVVTGQHREMLDQVLGLWGIVPDHDLDLMRPNQSLGALTSRALSAIGEVIAHENPAWVLVQGDTTSAMSAALAAFYQGVPVGHVEAGLRTYDLDRPFPEEANRRFVGLVSKVHFAPTERAYDNLIREGVPDSRVFLTGNTGVDAFRAIAGRPFDPAASALAELPQHKPLVLVTAHRRENFGHGLREICHAVRDVAERHGVHIAMPVHPNPHVSSTVRAILDGHPDVTLLPPLEYQPLVWLLRRCAFLLTDSGGLQEEAASDGKPVLVLRDTTERWEGVESGNAVLVGTQRERILGWSERLITDSDVYDRMSIRSDAYGDGRASGRIIDLLTESERSLDLSRPSLDSPAYDRPAVGVHLRDTQVA